MACNGCGDPTSDIYHISKLDSLSFIPIDKKDIWDEVISLIERTRGRNYGSQDDANNYIRLYKLMYEKEFRKDINPIKWSYLCLTNDYRRFIIDEISFYNEDIPDSKVIYHNEDIDLTIEEVDVIRCIVDKDVEYEYSNEYRGGRWKMKKGFSKKGYKRSYTIEEFKLFLVDKEVEFL